MSKNSHNARFECLVLWLEGVKRSSKHKRKPQMVINYSTEPIENFKKK
jgi:hypothetical protein